MSSNMTLVLYESIQNVKLKFWLKYFFYLNNNIYIMYLLLMKKKSIDFAFIRMRKFSEKNIIYIFVTRLYIDISQYDYNKKKTKNENGKARGKLD